MTWILAKLGLRGIVCIVLAMLLLSAVWGLKRQQTTIGHLEYQVEEAERATQMAVDRGHALAEARDEDVAVLTASCDSAADTASQRLSRAEQRHKAALKECRDGRLKDREDAELGCVLDVRSLGLLDAIGDAARGAPGDPVPAGAERAGAGEHPDVQ